MTGLVEIGLLLVALALIGFALAGPVRVYLRDRAEQEHVRQLSGEEPDELAERGRTMFARRLSAAGLPGPPEAHLFAVSVMSALVSMALLRLLPDFPVAALVGGAFAMYLPWMVVTQVARKRANRFERQLIDVIDLTSGTLQAGGNLLQALRNGSVSAKQPLKGEFEDALRAVSVGMPMDRAFGRIADRYDSSGIKLFTLTLAAKIQTGGDLVPLLRSLNETLRDRWRQQRQVRAQLSGARMTAIGAVILPYVLAPVLAWMQPGWFGVLLADPIGPPLLFLAFLLQMIGVLWLWRVLAREV